MNQFQINPNYRNKLTGETSKKLIDVLPKKLTFNQSKPTLFEETELVLIEHDDREKELFNLPISTSKYSISKTNEWIINKIKNHILSCWNKDKMHVVFYYPNIESKILAVILRQLYDENPDLGNILFVHIPPETMSFQELMEHIGWYTEYTLVSSDILMSKAFSKFDKAYWINSPDTLANNLNSIILEVLQDRAVKNFQLISSESYLHLANSNLNRLSRSPFQYNLFPDDTIFPFLAYPVLEAAIKSRHRRVLPFSLLEHLDKDLSKFGNYSLQSFTMPQFLYNYVMSLYNLSWYHRVINERLIIPDRFTLQGEWSKKLLISMFCDTLIKKGYYISF
jgi:hypothetical protein